MSNDSPVRNLVGYANSPPSILWPNGARVAISIVINFEEGAEWQVGDGDAISEKIGEVISVVEPGQRDAGQEQIFGYGSRVGLWRFLRSLEQSKTPATFFCCGQAVERSEDLARAIVDAGHEAACHGWRWRPHTDYTNGASEKKDLLRCIDTFENCTGQRPHGFFCRGSESPWTRSILSDLGFRYTSNAFDDDLPYFSDSSLVVVPYNLDCNDMKFFHPNGFTRAQEMVEYVKDAVSQLLLEAQQGRFSTLSIGYHLRISGRPARFRAFTDVLAYLKSLGDQIWLARRSEIADAFKNDFGSNTTR